MLMMTIKRTTNCSEEGDIHVEVTEDPIEQPHAQTDRQTDGRTNVILYYNGTSFQGFATNICPEWVWGSPMCIREKLGRVGGTPI
jgi:hypothetical protein